MDKVYCINCIFLKKNAGNFVSSSDKYSCKKEIENLSKMVEIDSDSWLIPGSCKYVQIKKDRRPFEINANNDCEWFIKKQKHSIFRWWF